MEIYIWDSEIRCLTTFIKIALSLKGYFGETNHIGE